MRDHPPAPRAVCEGKTRKGSAVPIAAVVAVFVERAEPRVIRDHDKTPQPERIILHAVVFYTAKRTWNRVVMSNTHGDYLEYEHDPVFSGHRLCKS